MREKRKTAKKFNTAFGLVLILAVIIASPVFGFGLGLATMEWKPSQASPMTPSISPNSFAPVPEPAAQLTPEPTAPPSVSPTPDYSANPLSRPVPVKIEEPTLTQNENAEQKPVEATSIASVQVGVNGEAAAANETNSNPAQPESSDRPGESAPIPLREATSEPMAETPSPAPTPSSARQGAPVPFRKDSSEGEAFTIR
jgi:hypothetical protein